MNWNLFAVGVLILFGVNMTIVVHALGRIARAFRDNRVKEHRES